MGILEVFCFSNYTVVTALFCITSSIDTYSTVSFSVHVYVSMHEASKLDELSLQRDIDKKYQNPIWRSSQYRPRQNPESYKYSSGEEAVSHSATCDAHKRLEV